MTPRETEAVVRGLYDSFNLKDLDRFDAVAEFGATTEWTPFEHWMGLREAWELWARAFPDAQVEIVRIEAHEGSALAQVIGRGTHLGALELPTGTVAPTHRSLELHLAETFELEGARGKIVRAVTAFNVRDLFHQLGLPPPTPPVREPVQAEFHWGY
jgi:hypothetical protein